jgi:Mrp family chromosome partitioning ATPase
MALLLQALRRTYDVILVDTPPLTLADARILGPLADGVVIVLRAGAVRLDSVLAAEQRLTQDGSHVLGTVLNDWDPRSNGYGVYPDRYHESGSYQTA